MLPPINDTLDKSQFLNIVSIKSTLSKLQSTKDILLNIHESIVILLYYVTHIF